MFAIAYFTGSRIGEVLKLKVSDIEGDRVLFRAVNIKTKATRAATMTPGLRAILKEYDAPTSGYLFPAGHNGGKVGHLSRQAADKVLREVCQVVGLDGVSTHSFRHSFATNLYRNGEPMAKICRLLGYKNPTMTVRYIG